MKEFIKFLTKWINKVDLLNFGYALIIHKYIFKVHPVTGIFSLANNNKDFFKFLILTRETGFVVINYN